MASHGPAALGERGSEEKRCAHCGSGHTAGDWRRHPTTSQRLCNACAVYADKHGGQLPPDSVLQRRPAQPRRMEEVRRDVAQRHCVQCGSASPGSGKRPSWRRHPATGEEWLCGLCRKRIDRQHKGRSKQQRQQKLQQQQEAAGEHSQQEHSSNGASSEEGEQAPAAQPLQAQRPKRKRQQEEQHPERDSVPACHVGAASAAEKRARGTQQAVASDGGLPAPHEAVQPELGNVLACLEGGSSKVPLPAAQRRQRRKPAHPQHLPPPPPRQRGWQPAQEPLMAPTDLVEGAVEPSGSEGVASLGGPAAAAGKAPQAAVPAAASLDAAPPAQLQQAAEMQAGQHMQPTEAEPEQDVFDLLQAVVEVAAAAPSGLTPELAAAFVMLPNLDARREAYLRRLQQRGQYSAAAVQMRMAVHLAGFALPAPA